MYQIMDINGEMIGMTDQPMYVLLASNGCYQLTNESNSQGIQFNGNVYHSIGRPSMKGLEPEVYLQKIDDGAITYESMSQTSEFILNTTYNLVVTNLNVSALYDSFDTSYL